MAGLVPAISFRKARRGLKRDRRDKPGDDDGDCVERLRINKNKKAATVSRGGFLIAEGSSARLFDRDEVLSFAGLAVTYSSKP
jgi:hypothetical protein